MYYTTARGRMQREKKQAPQKRGLLGKPGNQTLKLTEVEP